MRYERYSIIQQGRIAGKFDCWYISMYWTAWNPDSLFHFDGLYSLTVCDDSLGAITHLLYNFVKILRGVHWFWCAIYFKAGEKWRSEWSSLQEWITANPSWNKYVIDGSFAIYVILCHVNRDNVWTTHSCVKTDVS